MPFWIILLASHERQRLLPSMFCDFQTIEVFAVVWYSSISNKPNHLKELQFERGACGAYHLYIIFLAY